MINKLVVKKVQIEMLQDRGYDITDKEKELLTLDTTKKYKNLPLNQVYNKNNTSLYVYYMVNDNPLDDFKTFVEQMINYDSGIIIGTNNKELNNKKYKKLFDQIPFKPIQTFKYRHLTYNVTKIINYDKHELVLDKSTIIPKIADVDQLPQILIKDKIVRYFGYAVGDIIKITRQYDDINLLSQTDIGYRVVVDHTY